MRTLSLYTILAGGRINIRSCRAAMLALLFCLSLSFVSCTEETLDYNNPDVDLFVKQLKGGKYSVESPEGLNTVPRFTVDDIEGLLKYAEDLTVIPSFPLAPVSYSAGGKLRLGECIWDRMLRWAVRWCMRMRKIMKASTSCPTTKCWMPPPVIAVGGRAANIPARCGP